MIRNHTKSYHCCDICCETRPGTPKPTLTTQHLVSEAGTCFILKKDDVFQRTVCAFFVYVFIGVSMYFFRYVSPCSMLFCIRVRTSEWTSTAVSRSLCWKGALLWSVPHWWLSKFQFTIHLWHLQVAQVWFVALSCKPVGSSTYMDHMAEHC